MSIYTNLYKYLHGIGIHTYLYRVVHMYTHIMCLGCTCVHIYNVPGTQYAL